MRAAVVVGVDVNATLPQVLEELPSDLLVIVVDDGSKVPLSGPNLIRHPKNRGYGAAQRTGYREALRRGATRIALVHGDNQYKVRDVVALLDALDNADIALGSRFLAEDRGAIIPWWRRWANVGLTALGNKTLGTTLSEMHTGARAYRAEALDRLPLERFSDDYLFDQQLIAAMARDGARFVERPVRVRYDDAVQSIGLRRSVRYGAGCVRELLRRSSP